MGELLTNSLITLVSQTRTGPGLQSRAGNQAFQSPAEPLHPPLLSVGTELFSEQIFNPLAQSLEAQVKEALSKTGCSEAGEG